MSDETAVPANHIPGDDDGMLDQVAIMLTGITAEEISDAVIGASLMCGALDPELEDEPDNPERARQLKELFDLLDRATVAVSDGSLVPRAVPGGGGEPDPEFTAALDDFVEANRDPEAEKKMDALLGRG